VSEQSSPAISQQLEPIDPGLAIGAVRLAVSDLARSVDFYERVLGLPAISREGAIATLGTDAARPALVLEQLPRTAPLPVRSTGLFHVAWLHPSRPALAETVHRIAHASWPLEGASDHGVSEAIYLADPDGLGIEIYADRPEEQWPVADDGSAVRMITVPLDVEDLLEQSSRELCEQIAPGTRIGHVHLKVSAVPRSVSFYRDVLGFSLRAEMPSAAFLAADGYHHHIGANSWQSAGAGPPPLDAPGVRLIEFALSSDDALTALERSLTAAGASEAAVRAGAEQGARLSIADPDAHALAFTAR
jgi:catechol 2,3-dioxygenase